MKSGATAGCRPAYGIRQFTVGTGGEGHHGLRHAARRPARSATTTTFGILKLTLHATTYDWVFLPIGACPLSSAPTAGRLTWKS